MPLCKTELALLFGVLEHLGKEDDISRKRVREAKRLDNEVICYSAYNLPFRDEAFGCVVISEVLEHLGDPYIVLREAHRVLKTGGILIIATPNCSSHSSAFDKEAGHIIGFTVPIIRRA